MRQTITKTKYNSKKITYNGLDFDSHKEMRRYKELLLLQKTGAIQELQTQVKFVLIPAQYDTFERYSKTGKRLKDGKRLLEREVSYIADFVYKQDGKRVVEDVKGFKESTAYAVFVIKRKLMLHVHGIQVREI